MSAVARQPSIGHAIAGLKQMSLQRAELHLDASCASSESPLLVCLANNSDAAGVLVDRLATFHPAALVALAQACTGLHSALLFPWLAELKEQTLKTACWKLGLSFEQVRSMNAVTVRELRAPLTTTDLAAIAYLVASPGHTKQLRDLHISPGYVSGQLAFPVKLPELPFFELVSQLERVLHSQPAAIRNLAECGAHLDRARGLPPPGPWHMWGAPSGERADAWTRLEAACAARGVSLGGTVVDKSGAHILSSVQRPIVPRWPMVSGFASLK